MNYNKLSSEKKAEENELCRKIVREIISVGLNQHQIWMMIYLLGFELESVDEMREVAGFVKEMKGDELFLSQEEKENTNG